MRRLYYLAVCFVALAGCSGTQATPGAGDAAVTADGASAKDAEAEAGASAVCAPPAGTTCPTTSGTCKGIGKPSTKGGGQCGPGTSCDLDLDPTGAGICITYLSCTRGNHDCGAGASCCQTKSTQNVPVCLPNPCIPSDCTIE